MLLALGRVLGEVCVVLASERVLGLVWVMLGSDGARKGVFIVSERVPNKLSESCLIELQKVP